MKKIMQWTVILVVMAAIWLTAARWETVQALRDGAHTADVLLRADRELTPKTAAGQYYHRLVWQHNAELIDIFVNRYPEHHTRFFVAVDAFIPAIEALLDGDGDSVTISAAQIDRLQTELNWLKSVGSDALRADIEREERRFPPEQFIGMTIAEAYERVVAGDE